MNNLQALTKLKQSAKEQSKELENTILEIHKQNSKSLLENLKATHEQRSKSLEKSIQVLQQEAREDLTKLHKKELEKIKEMISEKLESGNKWKMVFTILATFILTLIITLGIIYLTMTKQYNQQNQTTFYFYKIEHNKSKE